MMTKFCSALLLTLALASLTSAEETSKNSLAEKKLGTPVHGLLTREDKALFSAHVEKPIILSDKMRSLLNSEREGELRTHPSVNEAVGKVITSLKGFTTAAWIEWNPLIIRVGVILGVMFVSSLLKK